MTPADPLISSTGIVLADAWSAAYVLGGRLEKLDVLPHTNDALIQFRLVDTATWSPSTGVLLTQGVFQSLSGLGELFAEHGYVDALRYKRATAGAAATLDLRCYLI